MRIIDQTQIVHLQNWHIQLAELTRIAWSDEEGRCYFPYRPLTTPEFWLNEVLSDWQTGKMDSWAVISNGKMIAHACMVNQGEFWELGRMVTFLDSPKGTMTQLIKSILSLYTIKRRRFRVECTQFHNATQKICDRVGLRFAGIGFLDKIDGIWWDIIFFDNQVDLPEFSAQEGVLGDPLGQAILVSHPERLIQIPELLSIENGGQLPPHKFHVLPRLLPEIQRILRISLPTAKLGACGKAIDS
jgi:hypothetical protein